MPAEQRSPTANTQTSMKIEPLEGIPRLRRKLNFLRWKLNQKAEPENPLAHACDDTVAGKPCTGNLYARFEEGSGGLASRSYSTEAGGVKPVFESPHF